MQRPGFTVLPRRPAIIHGHLSHSGNLCLTGCLWSPASFDGLCVYGSVFRGIELKNFRLDLVASITLAISIAAGSAVHGMELPRTGVPIPESRPSDDITGAIDRSIRTSAVPARLDGAPATSGDISVLKAGLDALSKRDTGAARAAAGRLPERSLDRRILLWAIALRGGDDVSSREIAGIYASLAGWPGQTTMRINSEKALLREKLPAKIIVGAFGGTMPKSPEGAIVLARAFIETGNKNAALKMLSEFWRTTKMDAKDEAAIIKEFGSFIPSGAHRFRMEKMLYEERIQSAERVAKLAGAEALCNAWAAVIRRKANAGALLDKVPQVQQSAGYLFARAQYLRRQNDFVAAAKVMAKAPSDQARLVDADAWWTERRVLSRELIDAGKEKLAYQVAAGHAAESASKIADAEFHAGWYALRALRDPKSAALHFARIAEVSSGPISNARAYYWLGRSAEERRTGKAAEYYQSAARHGTTFYGQLAAAKLGRSTIDIAYPKPSDADRAKFERREAVQVIRRIEAAGHESRANAFYLALAEELNSPGELALLAVMAERRGDHRLALQVGKAASARGIEIGALAHPLGAIPDSARIAAERRSLAYAVARQESEFHAGAVSPAGAQGLLQLLPGTAKDMAKKTGITFSKQKLTSDAGYNATLGAAYLEEQLGRFGGSYILTFAGYNAGPKRAEEWIRRYGDPRRMQTDQIVDWIERIPFTETRNYVQRVMENHQVYNMRISGHFDIVGDLKRGN